MSAPEGTILNAPKPNAVASRHVIGQMLPDVTFGCLRQVVPDRVPAEGTSCLWNINVRGRIKGGEGGNYGFGMAITSNGGTGARADKDGLSATAYPSGVRGTPVEIAETQTPLIFWRKEFRPDSGGAGRTRGGLGQIMEIESGIAEPFDLLAAFDRIDYPPRGRDGGGDGEAGFVALKSGQTLKGKGFQLIPPGDRLVVMTPGGAGIGAPAKRDRSQVANDLADGLISEDTAEEGLRIQAAASGRVSWGINERMGVAMKLGRRTALKAGVGMGAIAVLGAPAIVQAQAGVKLPLATVWPDGNFHTVNAKRFADEVKTATSGAVEIDVKSGGQLGFKGPEQLRAVRDGLVPMADILNIQQVGDEPIMGVEGIPFISNNIDELKVLHKYLRPEYEKVALKNNQTILYMVPWPTQYLHLKVKAESLDALKGIKIRVPDKNAQEMCSAIGMAPALIPWGETIAALSSGAVSGVSTSSVSGVDGKFWEFLKFFHQTNHAWSSQIVTINNDTWKKISPANQKVMTDLAKKLEPEFWVSSLKADADSNKRLTDGGMQIVIPSPQMMADLRKKTEPMIAEFIKRVPAAEKPIKAYLVEMKRA